MWLTHLNSTPPSLPNDEIAMVLTPAYRGFGRDRMPETVQTNLPCGGMMACSAIKLAQYTF